MPNKFIGKSYVRTPFMQRLYNYSFARMKFSNIEQEWVEQLPSVRHTGSCNDRKKWKKNDCSHGV